MPAAFSIALQRRSQRVTARYQRHEPTTRSKALRAALLTAHANAILQMTFDVLATEARAKVEKGTGEEVEATIGSFTAHIYDASWFVD